MFTLSPFSKGDNPQQPQLPEAPKFNDFLDIFSNKFSNSQKILGVASLPLQPIVHPFQAVKGMMESYGKIADIPLAIYSGNLDRIPGVISGDDYVSGKEVLGQITGHEVHGIFGTAAGLGLEMAADPFMGVARVPADISHAAQRATVQLAAPGLPNAMNQLMGYVRRYSGTGAGRAAEDLMFSAKETAQNIEPGVVNPTNNLKADIIVHPDLTHAENNQLVRQHKTEVAAKKESKALEEAFAPKTFTDKLGIDFSETSGVYKYTNSEGQFTQINDINKYLEGQWKLKVKPAIDLAPDDVAKSEIFKNFKSTVQQLKDDVLVQDRRGHRVMAIEQYSDFMKNEKHIDKPRFKTGQTLPELTQWLESEIRKHGADNPKVANYKKIWHQLGAAVENKSLPEDKIIAMWEDTISKMTPDEIRGFKPELEGEQAIKYLNKEADNMVRYMKSDQTFNSNRVVHYTGKTDITRGYKGSGVNHVISQPGGYLDPNTGLVISEKRYLKSRKHIEATAADFGEQLQIQYDGWKGGEALRRDARVYKKMQTSVLNLLPELPEMEAESVMNLIGGLKDPRNLWAHADELSKISPRIKEFITGEYLSVQDDVIKRGSEMYSGRSAAAIAEIDPTLLESALEKGRGYMEEFLETNQPTFDELLLIQENIDEVGVGVKTQHSEFVKVSNLATKYVREGYWEPINAEMTKFRVIKPHNIMTGVKKWVRNQFIYGDHAKEFEQMLLADMSPTDTRSVYEALDGVTITNSFGDKEVINAFPELKDKLTLFLHDIGDVKKNNRTVMKSYKNFKDELFGAMAEHKKYTSDFVQLGVLDDVSRDMELVNPNEFAHFTDNNPLVRLADAFNEAGFVDRANDSSLFANFDYMDNVLPGIEADSKLGKDARMNDMIHDERFKKGQIIEYRQAEDLAERAAKQAQEKPGSNKRSWKKQNRAYYDAKLKAATIKMENTFPEITDPIVDAISDMSTEVAVPEVFSDAGQTKLIQDITKENVATKGLLADQIGRFSDIRAGNLTAYSQVQDSMDNIGNLVNTAVMDHKEPGKRAKVLVDSVARSFYKDEGMILKGENFLQDFHKSNFQYIASSKYKATFERNVAKLNEKLGFEMFELQHVKHNREWVKMAPKKGVWMSRDNREAMEALLKSGDNGGFETLEHKFDVKQTTSVLNSKEAHFAELIRAELVKVNGVYADKLKFAGLSDQISQTTDKYFPHVRSKWSQDAMPHLIDTDSIQASSFFTRRLGKSGVFGSSTHARSIIAHPWEFKLRGVEGANKGVAKISRTPKKVFITNNLEGVYKHTFTSSFAEHENLRMAQELMFHPDYKISNMSFKHIPDNARETFDILVPSYDSTGKLIKIKKVEPSLANMSKYENIGFMSAKTVAAEARSLLKYEQIATKSPAFKWYMKALVGPFKRGVLQNLSFPLNNAGDMAFKTMVTTPFKKWGSYAKNLAAANQISMDYERSLRKYAELSNSENLTNQFKSISMGAYINDVNALIENGTKAKWMKTATKHVQEILAGDPDIIRRYKNAQYWEVYDSLPIASSTQTGTFIGEGQATRKSFNTELNKELSKHERGKIGTAANWVTTENNLSQKIGDFNARLENMMRFSQFATDTNLLEGAGLTPEQIALSAESIRYNHMHFAEMTGDAVWLSAIFPFWQFPIKNATFWMDMMMKKPYVAGNIGRVQKSAWDDDDENFWAKLGALPVSDNVVFKGVPGLNSFSSFGMAMDHPTDFAGQRLNPILRPVFTEDGKKYKAWSPTDRDPKSGILPALLHGFNPFEGHTQNVFDIFGGKPKPWQTKVAPSLFSENLSFNQQPQQDKKPYKKDYKKKGYNNQSSGKKNYGNKSYKKKSYKKKSYDSKKRDR